MPAVRFYTDSNFLSVGPDDSLDRVSAVLSDLAPAALFVVGEDGGFLGTVDAPCGDGADPSDRVARFIRPPAETPAIHADADIDEARGLFLRHDGLSHLPVIDGGRLAGVLLRSVAFRGAVAGPPPDVPDRAGLLETLLRHMPTGLFIVGGDNRVALANEAFHGFFDLPTGAAVGRPVEEVIGPFFADRYSRYLEQSPAYEARRSGSAILGRERRTRDGRTFLVDAVPLPDGSVLVNFDDITAQKRSEQHLAQAWREVEQAFALLLPNSVVERKLKSSPEYRDEFDPETGLIRITGVIPDGTYHHVVNALKVASDLKAAGAMGVLGLDKDRIVQTMIYHDLGKIQPVLAAGDVVDPREAFEPSKLHAARSADFAAGTYVRDEDTLLLIRHHHHAEHELPADFPRRLLPMLRMVQLIDGLSAAVTRKGARLAIAMEREEIVVREFNPHANYNGTHRLDLFAGRRQFVRSPAGE